MESKFKSNSAKIALFTIMTAVTVVANLIMVPMPQPLAQYDLSPVLILSLGVLMNPILALVTIATAMGIGVGYKMVLYGFPPVYVIGAMLVRGTEAAFISYLVRMKKQDETISVSRWEILAMALGTVWETLGFYSIDFLLFGGAAASVSLLTIIDIVFIPLAIGVLVGLRKSLKIRYLT